MNFGATWAKFQTNEKSSKVDFIRKIWSPDGKLRDS